MWSGCDCGFVFRKHFIQHSEGPFKRKKPTTRVPSAEHRINNTEWKWARRKSVAATTAQKQKQSGENNRVITCMSSKGSWQSARTHTEWWSEKKVVDKIRNESLRCLASTSLSCSSVIWLLTSCESIWRRDWAWIRAMKSREIKS